tara:strand:+ start:1930 stop:3198 length:1269 start_codon:yes stop_codon:yes gene_type:complete
MLKKDVCKRIYSCRLCKSKNIVTFFDLGNQPLANRLKKSFKERETKFPLRLFFCKSCRTSQLTHNINSKILFSKYLWQTSTSNTAKKFSDTFCSEILKRIKIKRLKVLEIASNDGTFLIPFKKRKHSVLGIDPAKNISRLANKKGIKTLSLFFKKGISKKILRNQNKFHVVFARNVIAHVENIHEVVDEIKKVINNDGLAAIEFHYSKHIIQGLQYDSIYHEHLFYFSLNSIKHFFEKKGLFLFDVFNSPISGGAIVALFSKNKKSVSQNAKKMLNLEKKNKINSFNTWKKFSKLSKKHSKKLNKILAELSKKNKIVGYGASARSSTLLNYSNLNHKNILFILDKNKLKKNKFTAGSNIKILDFDVFKSKLKRINNKIKGYNFVILILAWNFSKEIIKDLKMYLKKSKIIIPLPKKIIVKNI